MIKVKKIINNNKWIKKEDDEIVLDYLDRNRRRIRLKTKKKVDFLIDEKKIVLLIDGALLILTNNYRIKVKAKPEAVYEIKSNSAKNLLAITWHIGNRHVPAEIHKNYVIIKRDEVIGKMLKLLGAKVEKKKLAFSPVSGAYN